MHVAEQYHEGDSIIKWKCDHSVIYFVTTSAMTLSIGSRDDADLYEEAIYQFRASDLLKCSLHT